MCPKCVSDFVPKLIGNLLIGKCFGDRQKKKGKICWLFSILNSIEKKTELKWLFSVFNLIHVTLCDLTTIPAIVGV